MKNSIFLFLTIALVVMMFSCEKDDDNPAEPSKNYDSVTIGTQVWMAKNLDVDHYRNGDAIPQVTDPTQWNNLKTGAWCYYKNDPANGEIYGKLYNWYAVNDSRGLAPDGWHVPTDDEWKELEMCLGMSQTEADSTGWRGTDQGSQLAGSADLWQTGALKSNSKFGNSGFSALPGGWRNLNGTFGSIGYYANWWSATECNATNAWYRGMSYGISSIFRSNYFKEGGFAVRCVRDY